MSTGGCAYTCNRRTGAWREKLCRCGSCGLPQRPPGWRAPSVCGAAFAPQMYKEVEGERKCGYGERWDTFLNDCLPEGLGCLEGVGSFR